MYTPPPFTLSFRQYSCGGKHDDMRPTRVKCWDERYALGEFRSVSSMDAIHFNNDAFHLDTAGVNWGYGLGAFLHLFFDLGLGNNPRSVPMNPVVF